MSLVIVADDDGMIRDIVRAALERRGYLVGSLSDGKPVRDVVELKFPDAVILDCGMAQVSGIDALRAIRASDKVHATPVLMLTARCSVADERIALNAGADDYLRKPFDPDELVARIDSLIAKSARHQSQKLPPGTTWHSDAGVGS
jgi:DNA-binding response OmpR family regulator